MPILSWPLKSSWGTSSHLLTRICRVCVRMGATIWSRMMGSCVVRLPRGGFLFGAATRYFAGREMCNGYADSTGGRLGIYAGGWSTGVMLRAGWDMPVHGKAAKMSLPVLGH